MLGPHALTTLASVKTLLQMRPSQTENDALLERLINVATGKIETFTKRRLKLREYEDDGSAIEEDGEDSVLIHLIEWPIVEVSLVRIDGTDLAAEGYLAYLDQGLIRLVDRRVGVGFKNVRVDFSAGYDPVPDDLAFIADDLVAELFIRHSASDRRIGLASRTVGDKGETYTPEDNIPPRIANALIPWCRGGVRSTVSGVA